MNETDWPAYLSALSTNQSEIARAADVHSGTVSRWFSRSSHPLAPQVIAVARAFNQSPVIALLAAGYLTRDEVEGAVTLSPGMTLAEFSELDIAQELVRRIEAGETTAVSDAPLEVDHPAWANVGGAPEHEDHTEATTPVRTSGAALSLDGDNVIVDGTSFAAPKIAREIAGLIGQIEELDHAAKHDAVEVEEDQHTP